MIVYIVRHGQTDWNLEGRIQGHSNIDLNTTGILQANDIAQMFININLDLIISSPLNRALDTAKIINQYKKLPIITNDTLIERDYGDFEGTNQLHSYGINLHTLLDYKLNYSDHNVESIQLLFKRVRNFIDYCKSNYSDKNLLIVTHNGICQVLESILSHHSLNTDLLTLSLETCGYRKYIF